MYTTPNTSKPERELKSTSVRGEDPLARTIKVRPARLSSRNPPPPPPPSY